MELWARCEIKGLSLGFWLTLFLQNAWMIVLQLLYSPVDVFYMGRNLGTAKDQAGLAEGGRVILWLL